MNPADFTAEKNGQLIKTHDSHMSWMAELMYDIKDVLNKTKQFE